MAPRMVCLHGGGDSLFPAFISPKWRRLSSFPGLAEPSSFAPLTPGRSKKSDGGASKDLVRRLQLSLTSCDWNEYPGLLPEELCHLSHKPFEVDDRSTPLRPETRPAVRSHGFSGGVGRWSLPGRIWTNVKTMKASASKAPPPFNPVSWWSGRVPLRQTPHLAERGQGDYIWLDWLFYVVGRGAHRVGGGSEICGQI